MRRSGLIVPKPQDVCIFCSARWILVPPSEPPSPSPSRPRHRPRQQRRFFTSGQVVHQPLATATATATATAQAEPQSQNETKINGSMINGGGAFPQSAGGWPKKKTFMAEFGMKKTSAIPDPSSLNSLPSDSLVRIRGGQGLRLAESFISSKSRKHLGKKSKVAPILLTEDPFAEANDAGLEGKTNEPWSEKAKWKCRSCGHTNTASTHCTNCQSLNFTYTSESQSSKRDSHTERRWSHLKFISSIEAAKKARTNDPDVQGSVTTTSQLDQSREERLAQTKDGQYVGFRSSATPAEGSAPSTGFKMRFNMGLESHPQTSQPRERIKHQRARTVSTQLDKGDGRKRERKRSRFVSDYSNDDDDDMWEKIEAKTKRKKERAARKVPPPPTPIILPEYITIANLAATLRVPLERFGAKMHQLGFEDTNHDHILDAETAGLIASEFNYAPSTVTPNESHNIFARPPVEDKSLLPPRPPVVTIMGHVDHGKTTLLDWLRKSSVAASEHGGITQHIGAFSVSMPSGRLITFLDTPGHAAFLDMRQRGANVTDIVILVVAADDSVKPQTLEALKHAQTAKVPIVVAVNKVDKEAADVDRVKNDLARHGVEIEEYGGDTQVVPVSGKTGKGMLELEEAVIALADLLDVRAEKDGAVEGWVLEATKRKAGRAATVLVSRGTIRPGDIVVAGSTWARTRTLRDASGGRILVAGPGTPVEVDGWREQPKAGDQVLQAKSEKQAKSAVDHRIEVAARDQMAADMAALNERRRAEQQRREQEAKKDEEEAQQGHKIWERDTGEEDSGGSGGGEPQTIKSQPGTKDVFFIIKADVSGSVEAVVNSVSALGNSEVRPHIVRSGVGSVTEFDIDHMATAGGYIISFNLHVEPSMIRRADQAGVKIINHNIIYRLLDDVNAQLMEYLPPVITQRVLGEAEISQIFQYTIKERGQVPFAGCKIRNGVITRNGKVRVMRGGKEVYNGTLSSLKHVKKDVTEIQKGSECGIGFENWTAFEVGDMIQRYEEKIEKRTTF